MESSVQVIRAIVKELKKKRKKKKICPSIHIKAVEIDNSDMIILLKKESSIKIPV